MNLGLNDFTYLCEDCVNIFMGIKLNKISRESKQVRNLGVKIGMVCQLFGLKFWLGFTKVGYVARFVEKGNRDNIVFSYVCPWEDFIYNIMVDGVVQNAEYFGTYYENSKYSLGAKDKVSIITVTKGVTNIEGILKIGTGVSDKLDLKNRVSILEECLPDGLVVKIYASRGYKKKLWSFYKVMISDNRC